MDIVSELVCLFITFFASRGVLGQEEAGDTLLLEMTLEGKLNERFSPYGVWYDDLQSTKSQIAISKIESEVNAAQVYENTTTQCQVLEFLDRDYGSSSLSVYARLYVNITTAYPQNWIGPGTEVEVGVPVLDLTRFVVWDVTNEILRQCPVFLRLEVLQSVPETNVDRTWMVSYAFLVCIVSGSLLALCFVLTTSNVCIQFWLERRKQLSKKVRKVGSAIRAQTAR
ncbi:uncharacterized protein LOC142336879 [Convolutriloba macropyga]|uniref:uncharacterized protein LOC142336879 n=1 Tax=Convolutriloba macropyga TaxID=536237 RepID=UPI003F52596C